MDKEKLWVCVSLHSTDKKTIDDTLEWIEAQESINGSDAFRSIWLQCCYNDEAYVSCDVHESYIRGPLASMSARDIHRQEWTHYGDGMANSISCKSFEDFVKSIGDAKKELRKKRLELLGGSSDGQ
jgi:hypothetical protein